MDAADYFAEIVEPTIVDFEQHRASRRHTFLACVTLFHCIDYLAREDAFPNRQNLRNQLRRESKDFATIERVAHAFKHVDSDGIAKLAVTDIYTRPPARAGVMQAGLSRSGDLHGGVQILKEDGPDLIYVVKQAAEFLRAKIEIAQRARTLR
jgi:hypothetical protein